MPWRTSSIRRLATSGKKNVAVVDFTDLPGSTTELGRFLAEELWVDLAMVARGYRVIDRTDLKAILQENKLASSGVIDPLTARKLGQIAGVDTIITGVKSCAATAALFFTMTLFGAFESAAQGQRASTDGIKDLSDQISASAVKEQKRKIGVIPFAELDGRTTVLGAFLAEELTTKLFTAGGFDIVERQMLNKVMAELRLGTSGAVEASEAKQIGKLAGLDAIVTGTVTDLQSTVAVIAVNCRLIDVQTGRILGAAQTRISKDEDIRAVMAKPMSPTPTLAGGDGTAGPSAPSRTLTRTVSHGFTYELETCRLSGSNVRCAFYVTNDEADRELQLLGAARDHGVVRNFAALNANIPGTRAIDDSGNDLPLREGQLANYDVFGGMLVRGVRTRLILSFEGVNQQAKTFSVLDLGLVGGGDTFAIQLRHVPLSR